MLVGRGVSGLTFAEAVVDELQAGLEAFLQMGSVEDHVGDLLPQVALVLSPHDADRPLKLLASQPQFAIKRYIGQIGDKPVGSVEEIALPGQKLLAIPVGTDAVELLAEPPAGGV